jgi:hypothetical protein
MTKVWRGSLAAFMLSVLLIGWTPAEVDGQGGASGSARYRFTTLVDSQRDGLEPLRCAAINTVGTVAVVVNDVIADVEQIISKRSATDTPVVIADEGDGAPDSPTLCDRGFSNLSFNDVSINELGEVAFQGNLRRVTDSLARPDCNTPQQRDTPRQGVFLGRGGPLTTIAHTINEPGGGFIAEFLVADQSVNTLGRVAIVPELDDDTVSDHGLFVGSRSGTFNQRFLADVPTPDGFNFNNLSSRVSMNELGQIAFDSGLNVINVGGIFLSNPDGTFRTIVDGSSGLSTGDPSLNIFGRVAFTADRFDQDGNQIFSIATSRGGPITTVAESSLGGFVSFAEPSLNDLGEVVFTADTQPDPEDFFNTLQGVFTGGNPVRDKVLQAGDRYEGVRLTSVRTCAEGLNNRGQIVMVAASEDPDTFETRRFVIRATPRGIREIE